MKWLMRLMNEVTDVDDPQAGGGGAPDPDQEALDAAAREAMDEVMAERGGTAKPDNQKPQTRPGGQAGAEGAKKADDEGKQGEPKTAALDAAKEAADAKAKQDRDALLEAAAERERKAREEAASKQAAAPDILAMTDEKFLEDWRANATFKNPDPDTRASKPTLTRAELLENHPEYELVVAQAEENALNKFHFDQYKAGVEAKERQRQEADAADKFLGELEKMGHTNVRSIAGSKELQDWAAQQDEGVQALLTSTDAEEVNLALLAFYEATGKPMPEGVVSEADKRAEKKQQARTKLSQKFETKKSVASAPASNRQATEFGNAAPTEDQIQAEIEKGMESAPRRGKVIR